MIENKQKMKRVFYEVTPTTKTTQLGGEMVDTLDLGSKIWGFKSPPSYNNLKKGSYILTVKSLIVIQSIKVQFLLATHNQTLTLHLLHNSYTFKIFFYKFNN